jgi:hypothetical protein
MTLAESLRADWLQLRERLHGRQLLAEDASVSLRIPGSEAMWFGAAGDAAPTRLSWRAAPAGEGPALHAAVYAARADVGGVATCSGSFGLCLVDFGGVLPQVFDEQARHLGRMGPAAAAPGDVARALREGGNVVLVHGRPVCLGTTATRLALNAELFEKCAKAYVLAAATGGRVRPLPWIVRRVANGRLAKDERRAAERFLQGLLPEESKGY